MLDASVFGGSGWRVTSERSRACSRGRRVGPIACSGPREAGADGGVGRSLSADSCCAHRRCWSPALSAVSQRSSTSRLPSLRRLSLAGCSSSARRRRPIRLRATTAAEGQETTPPPLHRRSTRLCGCRCCVDPIR